MGRPQMEAGAGACWTGPPGRSATAMYGDIQSSPSLGGGPISPPTRVCPRTPSWSKPTSKLDETCRIEGEIPADAPKLESLGGSRYFDSLCVLRYTVPCQRTLFDPALPDLSGCEDLPVPWSWRVQDTADLSPWPGWTRSPA